MRNILFMLCCLFLGQASAQTPFSYTLKGKLSTAAFNGEEFPVRRYDNSRIIGKVKITGDTFEYHGSADSAMYCRIDAGTDYGNFIVEPGTVRVDMITHSFPSGTPLNDGYAEFGKLEEHLSFMIDSVRRSVINGDMDRETRMKKLNELEFDTKWINDLVCGHLKPFLLKHRNDELGVAICQRYLNHASPEALDEIYPLLGEWILGRNQIQQLTAMVNAARRAAPGCPFIDFTARDPLGNKTALSDYVGKGKYVIVDFSASWCGPCKAEMPYLSEVYNKYKGENFDMVTVMVWDKPENSKAMQKEFEVNWPAMIGAGMKPMELYGIKGIPYIILFAPDGKIAAVELRGELIGQKVAEVLRAK